MTTTKIHRTIIYYDNEHEGWRYKVKYTQVKEEHFEGQPVASEVTGRLTSEVFASYAACMLAMNLQILVLGGTPPDNLEPLKRLYNNGYKLNPF